MTPEDVMAVIGGELPPAPEVAHRYAPLPEPAEESSAWKPKKLPWWRRAIAAVAAAVALAIFWKATQDTDLSALVGGGTLTQEGLQTAGLYGVFLLSLFVLIAAVGGARRRSYRCRRRWKSGSSRVGRSRRQ